MWACPKCKETIEAQFDTCWQCGTKRDGTPANRANPEPAPAEPATTSGGGAAFAKGGCGCLVVFVVLAFLAVLLGGHVRADIRGLLFIFFSGGFVGLLFFSAYNKGRRDAGNPQPPAKPDDRVPPNPNDRP